MKGCDKEDEDIYSKWIQCNSGGMLPAVGSDKATAAEGGIAPDVMFICHTAGGRGIWSSCNPNFMSAAAVWLISLTKSTCSSPMISFILMFHFKLSIFCHDIKQRWVRSSLKYPISQYFGGNCFVCSPLLRGKSSARAEGTLLVYCSIKPRLDRELMLLFLFKGILPHSVDKHRPSVCNVIVYTTNSRRLEQLNFFN